jgi:hypothetical protein
MISGLGISSSGIASAVRTAGKARATMDTMARQLATGQRVASVKDDGAAWARANAARSESKAAEVGAGMAQTVAGQVDVVRLMGEEVQAGFAQLDAILTSALQFQPGSTQRAALARDYNAIANHLVALNARAWEASGYNGTWVNDGTSPEGHWYMNAFAPGTGLDGHKVRDGSWNTFLNSWVAAQDLNTMTVAQVQSFKATLAGEESPTPGLAWFYAYTPAVASDVRGLERAAVQQSQRADLFAGIAASLTDADLGRASAARAQAETRQQLALATVGQALNAYGAYAGGLLGNVQRTQRGINA